MIFRKEFALLGAIFGCFIFSSMAFPEGVVQSSIDGTANIPNIEKFGGWNGTIIFLLSIALIMLGTMLVIGIVITLIMSKNLQEVAIAYDVDAAGLKGMKPMQAAQMLNGRNETHDLIVENTTSNQPAISTAGGQRRLRLGLNNYPVLSWFFR